MKDGFIKVAACTPKIRVADVKYNTEQILQGVEDCRRAGANLAVFPELCLTGYTCQDLFFQEALLRRAAEGLLQIVKHSQGSDMILAVGLPLRARGKIYNCAAIIQDGRLIHLVPKTFLPNYGEFYEGRHFAAYDGKPCYVQVGEEVGAMMSQAVISVSGGLDFTLGFEICEDLWTPDPVSNHLVKAGAEVICNLSASNEVIGKDNYRRQLVANQSARLVAGYIYCSAGDGESTQDMVFSGHNLIAENGRILAESRLFANEITITELDVKRLQFERSRMSTYRPQECKEDDGILPVSLRQKLRTTKLTRRCDKTPFVPAAAAERNERCELILQMQSHGLMKRLEHTGAQTAVIGISGGLDSTLALLVCIMAMDLLRRPHSDIVAVTMPCFGTTKRTRSNAELLCQALGTSFRTVDITKSVNQHFADIGHDPENHNVVFENGQARERTKVLMNIANQCGGLVIGTGDLSELALGWATYNGDHMSMYGVNASVPKTLVRHIVRYYADTCGYQPLAEVLYDILDTPVSPELLPTDESGTQITQKTEDLVGPYELHDFYLYHAVRFGCEPRKVRRLAQYAFGGDYPSEVIDHWLKTFYRRFFSQQFKRSCLPDGAKIGSVSLSPRGDWRMPSDAASEVWLSEIS